MADVKTAYSLFSYMLISFFGLIAGCSEKAVDAGTLLTASDQQRLLIDDFSQAEGSRWEFISDQVMGGVSTGRMEIRSYEDGNAMHLSGTVSLENNGGFIQVRRPLNPKGKYLNAEDFAGVEIRVKADPNPYAVHLRSNNTWLPWQFYQAMFITDGSWQTIRLPFSDFEPHSLGKTLNKRKLTTVAIVAIKKAFKPDLLVGEVALYRELSKGQPTMYKELTAEEKYVIEDKGTERPFTGKYYDHFVQGYYTCKRCGAKLFSSASKFPSHCGWPSFDDELPQAVTKQPDADGRRTEILCANCGGHLGHVFTGEGFTEKNTRYCVNSISMDFVAADGEGTAEDAGDDADDDGAGIEGSMAEDVMEKELMKKDAYESDGTSAAALFASGCFWGTEYYFNKLDGVLSTTVGYSGGKTSNPTYKQVCTGETGHAETVEVFYDPREITYEALAKWFFETHDFTQYNRQGPDVGTQYRSAIFYRNAEQKRIAEKLVSQLKEKGYDVKTEITEAGPFYRAEDYHQDYYEHNGSTPYCHVHRKIF